MAKSFRELDVWQMSMDLVELIYTITSELPPDEKYGLKSQVQRSAVSIPSNIAEGFRRNRPKEFAHFLQIALGSCGELQTQIEIIGRVYPRIKLGVTSELSERISRMIQSLYNSVSPNPAP